MGFLKKEIIKTTIGLAKDVIVGIIVEGTVQVATSLYVVHIKREYDKMEEEYKQEYEEKYGEKLH